MPIQVGQPAPSFRATGYLAEEDEFHDYALEDYEGRWLCLYFYPMDFTFVCPTEIKAFEEALPDFKDRECDVLAVSCDTHLVHKGWCDNTEELRELTHPLLADVTRRMTMDYGLLIPDKGIPMRGTFIIDPTGIVRWQTVHDLNVGRNVDEVLRVLDALQTGDLCPCMWKKGDKTISDENANA